jgi:AcrR family transcriptional regulator
VKGIVMPRSKALSEQMRAQSLEALLSAARKLFAEKGFFNCRISDLASEAGMSQGNVYWYFPSKEAILQAVLQDGFESLENLMLTVAAQPGSSRKKLDALLEAYIEFGREKGEFTAILMSLMGHGGAPLLLELGFDLETIGFGYHQALSPIITQAQSEGEILPNVETNSLIMFYFAFFNGLMITYGRDWLHLPNDVIREAALRLVGVMPSPE